MIDEAVRKCYKMKNFSSLRKKKMSRKIHEEDHSCYVWRNSVNRFYRKHDMPIYTSARFKHYEFGERNTIKTPSEI